MKSALDISKALGDKNRLRAFFALTVVKELCVCQMGDFLKLAPATVSRHMSLLSASGLIEPEKRGRWVYYRLSSQVHPALLEWLKSFFAHEESFQEDRKLLETLTECSCRQSAGMKESREMDPKKNGKMKILFLCTGNSCRSQMAEGWTRYLKGDIIEPFSAGIETHGLNPNAVAVMKEAGVDISGHRSKNVVEFVDSHFDFVITVCGDADERCPFFPGETRVVHVGFDDPPKLALEKTTEEEKMDCYRRSRDEIRSFVETLPGFLENLPAEK